MLSVCWELNIGQEWRKGPQQIELVKMPVDTFVYHDEDFLLKSNKYRYALSICLLMAHTSMYLSCFIFLNDAGIIEIMFSL